MFAKGVTPPRSRIAYIAAAHSTVSDGLLAAMQQAEYLLCTSDAQANCDLSLIDLRGFTRDAKKAQALCEALRLKSPESPVIFLVSNDLYDWAVFNLSRFGEVVAFTGEYNYLVERCRELIRLRNIADETAERLKTLALNARAPQFSIDSPTKTNPYVLIAGDPSPISLSVINALKAIHAKISGVFSVGHAMRVIDNERLDCVIFLPAKEDSPAHSLMRALRRHRRYSHLGVIQITDKNMPEDYARAQTNGMQNILRADMVEQILGTRIYSVTRRSRVMSAMRQFLTATYDQSITDSLCDAYSSAFLTQYAPRMFARARSLRRALSAVFVQVDALPEEESLRRRVLRHTARTLKVIVRSEDIVARVSGSLFVVFTPATQFNDVEKIARRVEGVLSNTTPLYDGAEEKAMPQIRVSAHATDEDDSLETVLAAGLKALAIKPEQARHPKRYPQ